MATGKLPPALKIEPSGRWLGNDGSWSGFLVHAGTPPQNFTVLPTINGQCIYVPVADDCQRTNRTDCGSSRGVLPFGNRQSPGFQSRNSFTWELIGLYKIPVNRNLGYTGNGISGYDTIGLGSNDTADALFLEKQAMTAYATPDLWVGLLGLGVSGLTFRENEQVNSTLTNLKNNASIPSLSFGYTAGARYRLTGVPASLTLGGYDQARMTKTLTLPTSADGVRPFTIGLQSIVVSNSLNGTFNLLHQAIFTSIDSSVSELWLPQTVCEQFAVAFGLQYHEPSGRYALSESTRSRIRQLTPKLTFTVADGLVEGNTLNLQFPYATFDLEATYPIFPNTTAYFPIRRAANESQFVIGRSFLQEVYLGVDFERKYFNISQARFDNPMPEPDIITIMPLDINSNSTLEPSSSGTKTHQLSSGAIAGIVIGAITGTLLILSILWLRQHRRFSTQELPGGSMEDAMVEASNDHGLSELEPPGGLLSELDGNPSPRVYELR